MNAREVSAALAGSVSLGGEVSVNRLGFGAMRLTGEGIWGLPKDRTAAIAVLRLAVKLGVNFIDTADSYGPNVSEELIAEALFPYPADLVIATKGGWNRPGKPEEIATGTYWCLSTARTGPRGGFRGFGRNISATQKRRKDSAYWIVERHAGAHRASTPDRPNCFGAEPLQLCRPRMGLCRGLLQPQWNRLHPMVPTRSRPCCRPDTRSDRARK